MARTIFASVGANGQNLNPDVINVQELLNKVPPEEGGPLVKLKVDGLAWDKTISAIRKFQKEYLSISKSTASYWLALKPPKRL